MKYTCEVNIAQPMTQVIELFGNPANRRAWQPNLLSAEPISGRPGEPGSKARLKYNMNGREIDMVETVTRRSLPDDLVAQYQAKGVFNVVHNNFKPVSANETKWIMESEFQFDGFAKVLGWFTPGTFKRQSQTMMNDFKRFAETGKPVARI